MSDGHKLVEKMREEKNLASWSTPDLVAYLLEQESSRSVVLLDPQFEEYSFQLKGSFSIAEIEAMLINQINSRGSMRG
jgi:hypothetical protein